VRIVYLISLRDDGGVGGSCRVWSRSGWIASEGTCWGGRKKSTSPAGMSGPTLSVCRRLCSRPWRVVVAVTSPNCHASPHRSAVIVVVWRACSFPEPLPWSRQLSWKPLRLQEQLTVDGRCLNAFMHNAGSRLNEIILINIHNVVVIYGSA